MHGNNETPVELAQALAAQVGSIVVDHPASWPGGQLARGQGRRQAIWLRINPDVDVDTHGHTRTGHATSKFGLSLADGTAAAVALQALELPGVRLTGLHCHVGSQFREAGPLVLAVERLLALAASLFAHTGWLTEDLSPGGGWAVPYDSDQAIGLMPVDAYVPLVAQAVIDGCRDHGLPLPRLVLEPGRSLVARAGVAHLHRRRGQAGRQRNLRVRGRRPGQQPPSALYDPRYTAVLANRHGDGPLKQVHVAGPYCETGDVLIHDLELPPVRPGDLLAVPAGGAYQLSMSSNYNAARRPAVVWVEDGQARLIQRRETVDDLLARDVLGLMVSGVRYQVSCYEWQVLCDLQLDTRHSTLDTRHSTLDTRHSTLDTRHLTLDT